MVFTTPAIRAIRRHYPDARITYIVEEEAAAVVRHNPHLDNVIVARSPHAPGRLRADIALVRRLRRERYDLAIDFHGGPRSSLLTWLSGARTRIGYEVAGRSWMYTIRVPRPRTLRPRHSVVSQWDVLLPLGIAPPDPETAMRRRCRTIPRVLERRAPARRGRCRARPARDRRARQRRESLPALAVRGVRRSGVPARVKGSEAPYHLHVRSLRCGGSDGNRGRRAHATRHIGRQAILECGEFDLAELKALIARAALYIGGDSGPLHIAGTTGVPVVGLYGPTLPVRSQPFRSARFISVAAEVPVCRAGRAISAGASPATFAVSRASRPRRWHLLAERALGWPEGQHYDADAGDRGTGHGDADES